MFLVFINDIVDEIKRFIRLFADDNSLYIVVDNPLDFAIKLNIDLSRIDMWASMWLVGWGNCSQYESIELDKIQNEAARIVTGATLVIYNALLTETRWKTLLSRRKSTCKLILFVEMKNNFCPPYLASLVPNEK